MAMQSSPAAVVLAGINGSGKTTASRKLLAERLGLLQFVNADDIARGLNAFAPEASSLQAGRVMLERLAELVAVRSDFAFETTLSGRGYLRFLTEVRQIGYRVEVYYFWLASPETAIARVAERVRRGGHHIPEATIRQRYAKSIRNFWHHYRPLADLWYVYDNSTSAVALMAEGSNDVAPTVADAEKWFAFQRSVADAS